MYRPLAISPLLHACHLHVHTVHRDRAKAGRIKGFSILHIQRDGIGAILKRNGAVFPVEIHGEAPGTGRLVFFRVLRFLLCPLVYKDCIVSSSRRCFARSDVRSVILLYGQFYISGVAVAVLRHQRECLLRQRSIRISRNKFIAVAVPCPLCDGQSPAVHLEHILAGFCITGVSIQRAAFHDQLAVFRFAVRSEMQIKRTTEAAFPALSGQLYRIGSTRLRHIVLNHHGDEAVAGIAVTIRHHHFKLMPDGVLSRLPMFARGAGQLIRVLQLARFRVKARDGQDAFIRCNLGIRRQAAVFPHNLAADGDARYAVRGVDIHSPFRRDLGAVGLRSVLKPGFMYGEHVAHRIRAGSGAVMRGVRIIDDGRILAQIAGGLRRYRYAIVRRKLLVDGQIPPARTVAKRAVPLAFIAFAGPAQIQPAQAIQPVVKLRIGVFMIARAIAHGGSGSRRACGRHQIGSVHRREEILAGNLHPFQREGRHVFARIGGIEIFELDAAAVLKGEDKVIPGAGKRCGIRKEIEHETGLGIADNILGARNRLNKAYVSHDYLLKKNGETEKNDKTHKSPVPTGYRHRAHSGGTAEKGSTTREREREREREHKKILL